MGKQNKNVMHDAAGKKIMHPAEAMRKKAKKKKLEKMKGYRHENFEKKMMERSPEDILLEIRQLKADHERKRKARIDIHKSQLDRLQQLEVGYEKLKDQVQERHDKRQKESKSSLYIDFEELKIHRKASIYYHPVNNPYGAPPSGEMLMYRHPDGSVKREPPPFPMDSKADGDVGMSRAAADGSDESEGDEEGSESEDDGADPMLPETLPGMPPASSSSSIGPTMPPLPPGAPPLPGGPPLPPGQPPLPFGQPPLPGGQPPLPGGQPPLPFGAPPLPFGSPPMPFGQPPLPFGAPPMPLGQPPLPLGQPPLPSGQPPLPMGLPGSDLSQAAFMADLAKAGFKVPGLPPGPPPKNNVPGNLGKPPGPPPKPKAPKAQSQPVEAAASEGRASREKAVSELPAGARPPPPPAKLPSITVIEKPVASRASTVFTPTTLRTKKVSQVAGSALQATSASLSMDKRKNLIASEAPRVSEPAKMDDVFQDFMREVGE